MLEWEDKFSVGISIIDDQHKKLIGILNKAIYAKGSNGSPEELWEILSEMTNYALTHFKTEEFCMKYYKYDDYESHKEEHNKFTKIISDYSKQLMNGKFAIIDEVLEHLEQYLVNHIQGIDKKYAACFNENGLK